MTVPVLFFQINHIFIIIMIFTFSEMNRAYDGWPVVIGMDTRAFKAARQSCNCNSEITWIGSIVYKRTNQDFLKVKEGFGSDKMSYYDL